MFKPFVSVIVVAAVLLLGIAGPAHAGDRVDQRARLASKVKAEVAKLGTGEQTRIEVKLRDKSKVSGYVSEAGEAAFAVTDLKTGQTTQVPYDDVSKVKGQNLTTGTKIAIGAAIAVGVVVLVIVLLHLDNEQAL